MDGSALQASPGSPMVDMRQRTEFARVDGSTCAIAREVWPYLAPELPDMLATFYRHVETEPRLHELIGNRQPQLVNAQMKHWEHLFSCEFDDAYARGVVAIGNAHHRIGLTPQWYIAGYQFVLSEMIALLAKRNRFSTGQFSAQVTAICKIVMLDLDLALSAYEAAQSQEKERIIQTTRSVVGEFQDKAKGIVAAVNETAGSMKGAGSALTKATASALRESQTAASATVDTTNSIQAAAAASEELSASIREISQQLNGSLGVVSKAAEATTESAAIASRLTSATEKIGEVTGLIKSIADRTNLLALNASIEAARAGEAGKGFSVVAGEVKALAAQTKRATDDIARQIAQLQNVASQSGDAAGVITTVMKQIEERMTSIAAAVEEQSAATHEIATNMTLAAAATQKLSDATKAVGEVVGSTGEVAQSVLESSDRFSGATTRLTSEIDSFLRALWEGVLDRRKGRDPSYRGRERRGNDSSR